MATVVPFEGVLYNPDRAGDLSRVTAPPYDIISPAQQEGYYNDSPYNIIRLILESSIPRILKRITAIPVPPPFSRRGRRNRC